MAELEPSVVAYVEWIDAGGVTGPAWQPRDQVVDEARRVIGTPMRGAGILIDDHADSVTLTLADNPVNGDVGDAIVIPRRSIVRLERWDLAVDVPRGTESPA